METDLDDVRDLVEVEPMELVCGSAVALAVLTVSALPPTSTAPTRVTRVRISLR